MSKNALTTGIIACCALFLFALYKLNSCDENCRIVQSRLEDRQRRISQPPPPPPLPAGSNVSAECSGSVELRYELPGPSRKFPTNNERSDWMGDQYTNPCAVYFQILEGVMAFGTDYGFGVKGWHESAGRTEWPVHIDLVAGATKARWKYIACRQWHPVMKEWRCR